MITDLAQLDTTAACDVGAEIELLHPVTQAPLGIFWGVKGKDSQAFRDHLRDVINADLRDAAMAKKRGKTEPIPTMERGEERSIEILLACSTHWRTETKQGDEVVSEPHLVFEGEKLAFTPQNVRAVLKRLKWLREQVDAAIGDLENFLKV